MANNFDQTTDTHLAKKYNDALFDCMMRSNVLGFSARSNPHFDTLISYHAAVETFFNNTFFLFESVHVPVGKDTKILTNMLIVLNNEIEKEIGLMKKSTNYRSPVYFHQVQNHVSYMHKMIMYGLQKRQMLVRMSDREPRGEESVKYWDEKTGFKKGNLLNDVELLEKQNATKKL